MPTVKNDSVHISAFLSRYFFCYLKNYEIRIGKSLGKSVFPEDKIFRNAKKNRLLFCFYRIKN